MTRLLTKRIKHTSPSLKAAATFIVFAAAALILPVMSSPLDVASVLGATAIFYSILLGFYISAAMANLSRLKTLVATETGALIAIHRIVALSLPERRKITEDAIDTYLIKRFDYEISDYTGPTTNEYFAIFNVLKGANTKSDGEGAAINYIAEAMYYIAQARREITIVGAKILTRPSWFVLVLLSLIIVFSLFIMRDGSIESAVVTTLLATSAIMSLFILQDVDGNRLGEESFSVGTYQAVFTAIGRKHYYPTIYLEAGRYKPTIQEYRAGTSDNIVLVRVKSFGRKDRSPYNSEEL